MTLILCPSYSKGARASDTEILRLTSSASKSVVVDPSSTRPWRGMAPAQKRRASARVVFPAPPWPTRATLRILAGGKVFTPAHLARSASAVHPTDGVGASVPGPGGSLKGDEPVLISPQPGEIDSCSTPAGGAASSEARSPS